MKKRKKNTMEVNGYRQLNILQNILFYVQHTEKDLD